MTTTEVSKKSTPAKSTRFDIRVILAFFAIYILWGTTFLAIRIAVEEVPPLFAAGVRFFLAGVGLYGFMRSGGEPRPEAIQWRNLAIIGLLMFVAEYGPRFGGARCGPPVVTWGRGRPVALFIFVVEMF